MIHTAWQRLSLVPLSVRIAGLYALAAVAMLGIVAVQPLFRPPYSTPSSYVYIPEPVVKIVQSGKPIRLEVKRLNLSLPIKDGEYDAQTREWTLDDTSAFFATMTDRPNDDRGSTFIYGHNRLSAFEPLAGIRKGDIVTIYTKNGLAFDYVYSRDASIKPDMTKVLYEDPKRPQLILMTCEGILSETRRTMYFNLKEVRDV